MKRPVPSTPPVPAPGAAAARPALKGRNEQELHFLVERQKEFKVAAVNAKKQGDMQQATKYFKAYKVLYSCIGDKVLPLLLDIRELWIRDGYEI